GFTNDNLNREFEAARWELEPRHLRGRSAPKATRLARDGWLFRTAPGHTGTALSDQPMSQPDAWRMIRRRAAAAGIAAPIGCHTFRATGITAYLSNGGALEHAQEMAAHERRLIPLSQVNQHLGLAGQIRNRAGFEFFGRS